MKRKEGEADAQERMSEALRRIERLEREMQDIIKLNALNEFLLAHGRKAYFLFGPFDHDAALSKLEKDSNWPWREVNRRCNFCGCFLFPAKELDRVPPMNTLDIDYEQASRERMLEVSSRDAEFDQEIRDRMLNEPEAYLTYYYARGRKVPFGDYTVLYFHGPCFERMLDHDQEDGVDRSKFLGSD